MRQTESSGINHWFYCCSYFRYHSSPGKILLNNGKKPCMREKHSKKNKTYVTIAKRRY